jgi:hypothetical protein
MAEEERDATRASPKVEHVDWLLHGGGEGFGKLDDPVLSLRTRNEDWRPREEFERAEGLGSYGRKNTG